MSEKRIGKLEERLFGSSSPSGEEANLGEIKELEIQQGRIDSEINGLKEDYKKNLVKQLNLEAVLRDQFEFRIKWAKKALDIEGIHYSNQQLKQMKTQIPFYEGLLEKLDTPKQTEDERCKEITGFSLNEIELLKEIYLKEESKKEKETIKICPKCHAYYKGTHTEDDCNYNSGEASGGEKELPKYENGLNHIHGINSETSVPDSKPPKDFQCDNKCDEYDILEYICQHDPTNCNLYKPEIIEKNGVKYGKIEEFQKILQKALCKLSIPVTQLNLFNYLTNQIKEYKGILNK